MTSDNQSPVNRPAQGAYWGATLVAAPVAIIVLFVVSVLVGGAFAFIQYWMASMRAEAAIFIGILVGGAAGAYSARLACDAIFKGYSRKTIFVVFTVLALGAIGLEAYKGFDWQSVSRIGQWIVICIVGWTIFWKEEEL